MSYLLIFWALCIVIVVLYLYKISLSDRTRPRYELRSDFFNRSEFVFYQLLKKKLPEHFMIFSKTRIEDFIRVKSGFAKKEAWWLRSRIKSRHVDFLICNEHGNPKLAIEIDGSSHNHPERQSRDIFIDTLYAEVGIEILHIRVGEDFEERVNTIIEVLHNQ